MGHSQDQGLNFELIMSHIPTDMVVLGTDLRYQYVSPLTIKDEGLRNWIIGKTDIEFCEYRGVDNEVGKVRTEKLTKALHERTAVRFTEEYYAKEKMRIVERIYIPIVPPESSEVSHILGYSVDKTEQRKLKTSSKQLFQQILERESHKVSGSLARIKGLFDLLRMEKDPEFLLLYQDLIQNQIQEMTDNVQEVTHILYSGLTSEASTNPEE